MKIATAWSTEEDTNKAVSTISNKIIKKLTFSPSIIFVYSSVSHSSRKIISAFQKLFPEIPIHGGSSCLGVMTEDGFHSKDGVGIGALGIYDPKGSYGVAMVNIAKNARATGSEVVSEAIKNSGRLGEVPDLIWVSAAPGSEEEIIKGIQDVIGKNIPIAGGSTADNTVEGNWYQFTNTDMQTNAVVATAMYPSDGVDMAFHSGYSPTDLKGVISRAKGRTLNEINNEPAAVIYNRWTKGLIADDLEGGNILMKTTLFPLGRIVEEKDLIPFYQLSHPESVTETGALKLFSEVEVGQEIVLMQGNEESLITRAGRVARASIDKRRFNSDNVSGALVVYCAGCMLTIQNKMDNVVQEINQGLNEQPFLGIFTFGEQGCFIKGKNRHGNLMISVVSFN